MKIQVVPMIAEHYIAAATHYPAWGDPADHARAHLACGPCFSAFRDGVLLACAGVNILQPGVGEAWATWTPAGLRVPLVHRVIVRMLTEIIVAHNLHRVQAKAMRKFYVGRAWLHRLGFRREATLRRFGPNQEDFVQYVRLP